jgi:myosin V
LQESLIEGEATLLAERKESDAAKKSLTEAHVKNEELFNKIEVAEHNVIFQDDIQR